MGALDMNKSETLVTNNTREVFPGMICGGMELAELDGLPRMGASFGGMIASGRKAAKEAAQVFDSLEVVDGDVIGAKQQ
ncbi:unnamed protein product [Tilletia controversa]|uniref:Uncharacterized protein n=3 Tax=Tilletia TaxID=13289 RepID=A0ABN7ING2_9BASI|nr:unnamed protein product [Tilletia controversa]CAD6913851.1 unnamed protein product [Tilletia caries]